MADQSSSGTSPSASTSSASSSTGSKVGKFLWFSDMHLDMFYGSDQAASHISGANCKEPSTKAHFPFGRVGCDSPQTLVDEMLEHAHRVLSQPEFIVVTGDSCRHQNDRFPHPKEVLNTTLMSLTQSINAKYGGTDSQQSIMVLPTIGNNDITPDYELDLNNAAEPLQLIMDAWEPWITESDEVQTVKKGGYWARDVSDTLTVISINTIPYSAYHVPDQTDIEDPFDQFKWLNSVLENIQQSNSKLPKSETPRRAIIMGHIPPAIGSFRHAHQWHHKYLDRYWETVKYYRTIVASQLFGHLHSDEFRVVPATSSRDGESHADEPMSLLLTSSLTPIYGSNPSFRVMKYDTQTGVILDYDTYYIDLNDPDTDDIHSGLQWKQLEPFTQAFDVKDLSGKSLDHIVREVALFESVAQSLIRRKNVQTKNAGNESACDDDCRLQWACTLQSFTPSEYQTCLATKGSGTFTLRNISARTPLWVKTGFAAMGAAVVGLVLLLWVTDYMKYLRSSGRYYSPGEVAEHIDGDADGEDEGGYEDDDGDDDDDDSPVIS